MSWKSGEPFGRPRQHMIMSVVNVFTSMQQPLLKEDYTHLFKGTDHEAELTKAWKNFQGYLQEAGNACRKRENEASNGFSVSPCSLIIRQEKKREPQKREPNQNLGR
ncbi:unnamed protein product [Effrenium voratum]|uniref:Uncharacterized protein n=1 Tax=Effrenium voratum TaxID=2562239 RepID=A0AA36NFH6_9DINO|nr:unnamed protein product [Effrenium voratum]